MVTPARGNLDLEHEIAQKIVGAAYLECPYSNTTRGNIEVEI